MLAPNTILTLEIERPAVGGAMIARHEGEIVLVDGGIPGEVVRAQVRERTRNVAHATVVDVVRPSPDRREAEDPACGGRGYAHIAPVRQLALKREQVADALRRIAKLPDTPVLETIGDERQGYRLRAKLHWDGTRLGFLREGTHEVCEAGLRGQLSDGLAALVASLARELSLNDIGAAVVDLGESVSGTERAVRVALQGSVPPTFLRDLTALDVRGVLLDSDEGVAVGGRPIIEEGWPQLGVARATHDVASGLGRHPHAFFQGHRFLVARLVHEVLARIETESVVDLYAGVGLFGLAAFRAGAKRVVCVEGDAVSGEDLTRNALAAAPAVSVATCSVERWLFDRTMTPEATVVLDPPRTGLSREALGGLAKAGAAAIVYVSCDVATFARDAGRLAARGYVVGEVRPVDLFPDTGHVEVVATLRRVSHP